MPPGIHKVVRATAAENSNNPAQFRPHDVFFFFNAYSCPPSATLLLFILEMCTPPSYMGRLSQPKTELTELLQESGASVSPCTLENLLYETRKSGWKTETEGQM